MKFDGAIYYPYGILEEHFILCYIVNSDPQSGFTTIKDKVVDNNFLVPSDRVVRWPTDRNGTHIFEGNLILYPVKGSNSSGASIQQGTVVSIKRGKMPIVGNEVWKIGVLSDLDGKKKICNRAGQSIIVENRVIKY